MQSACLGWTTSNCLLLRINMSTAATHPAGLPVLCFATFPALKPLPTPLRNHVPVCLMGTHWQKTPNCLCQRFLCQHSPSNNIVPSQPFVGSAAASSAAFSAEAFAAAAARFLLCSSAIIIAIALPRSTILSPSASLSSSGSW